MQKRWAGYLATAAAMVLAAATSAGATVIDFTGGTATFNGGGTGVTNTVNTFQNVAFYEEDGFRLTFTFNTLTPTPFSSIVGNYYNTGNDVVHAHWATGNFGEVTEIMVSRIDGNPFDLNYFVLTSNTDTGGSVASGNEQAFITASNGFSQQLAPENWGFPAVQIFLGSQFDNITFFKFTVANEVDCFGMDNFFIDEEAPGAVPEPSTILLLGAGLAVAVVARRRRAA